MIMHPETANDLHVAQEDIIQVESRWGSLEAPVYVTEFVRPGLLVMGIGQGHQTYGRYAKNKGANPIAILPPDADPHSDGPVFSAADIKIRKAGRTMKLAAMYGSRTQHGRTFALSITTAEIRLGKFPKRPA